MPINYTLEVQGVLPEDSLNAFKNSYNRSSKMSTYKKYQDEIEEYFLSEVRENVRHQGIEAEGLIDGLSVNIANDKIEFKTNNPYLVNAIEYGSNHSVGQRFMQPSVSEVGKFMSNKILNEATSYYSNNTPIRRRIEPISSLPMINSNKYGFMLK